MYHQNTHTHRERRERESLVFFLVSQQKAAARLVFCSYNCWHVWICVPCRYLSLFACFFTPSTRAAAASSLQKIQQQLFNFIYFLSCRPFPTNPPVVFINQQNPKKRRKKKKSNAYQTPTTHTNCCHHCPLFLCTLFSLILFVIVCVCVSHFRCSASL